MSEKNNYAYESDWKNYVFPKQSAVFASEEDVKTLFAHIDFKEDGIEKSGMPRKPRHCKVQPYWARAVLRRYHSGR